MRNRWEFTAKKDADFIFFKYQLVAGRNVVVAYGSANGGNVDDVFFKNAFKDFIYL